MTSTSSLADDDPLACELGTCGSGALDIARTLSLVHAFSDSVPLEVLPPVASRPSSTGAHALGLCSPEHTPRICLKNTKRKHAMLFLGEMYAINYACSTLTEQADSGSDPEPTVLFYLYALPTADYLTIDGPLYVHSQAELSGPLTGEHAALLASPVVLSTMEIYRFCEQLTKVKPTAVRLLHSASYVAHPLWRELCAERRRFVCGHLIDQLLRQAEGYLRMGGASLDPAARLTSTKRKARAKARAKAKAKARATGLTRENPVWMAVRSCLEAESALTCGDLQDGICARDAHLVAELTARRLPAEVGERLLRERLPLARQALEASSLPHLQENECFIDEWLVRVRLMFLRREREHFAQSAELPVRVS